MTRGGTILWALVLVTLALLSRWSPLGVAPNTIRWVTQSEVEIFGYDIYRGPGQEGPFTIINPQSILAAGTTDLPQRYEYLDASIEPETVYWYYVETIALDGERERLTPTFPSRAKSPGLW